MSIAQTGRDARGRFAPGNTYSSLGGRARASALTPQRRRAIARKGWRRMVRKHFMGDSRAQRTYFAALGTYNYEAMAGTYTPGSPLRTTTRHPGTIQEFLSAYWQLDLLRGAHLDVQFYPEANHGRAG